MMKKLNPSLITETNENKQNHSHMIGLTQLDELHLLKLNFDKLLQAFSYTHEDNPAYCEVEIIKLKIENLLKNVNNFDKLDTFD